MCARHQNKAARIRLSTRSVAVVCLQWDGGYAAVWFVRSSLKDRSGFQPSVLCVPLTSGLARGWYGAGLRPLFLCRSLTSGLARGWYRSGLRPLAKCPWQESALTLGVPCFGFQEGSERQRDGAGRECKVSLEQASSGHLSICDRVKGLWLPFPRWRMPPPLALLVAPASPH